MSKHLADYVVEVRVFSIDPKNGDIKAQSMGLGLKAFNKGNARKRAIKFVSAMPNVNTVEVVKVTQKKP